MELVCSLVSQSVSQSVGFKDLSSHTSRSHQWLCTVPVNSLIPAFTTAVLRVRENSNLRSCKQAEFYTEIQEGRSVCRSRYMCSR